MTLLLATGRTNENCEGCDLAVVDLTPEFAVWSIGMIETLKAIEARETSIYEMTFFRKIAEYVNRWNGPDESLEPLFELFDEGPEYVEMPEGVVIHEAAIARTECDLVVIQKSGVSFSCYPKHNPALITTTEIPLGVLQKAVYGDKVVVRRIDTSEVGKAPPGLGPHRREPKKEATNNG